MVNLSKKIVATISLVFAASITANAASYSKDPSVVTDNLTNTTTVVLTPVFQGGYLGNNYELSHGIDNNKGNYDTADLAIGEDRNILMIYDLSSFASAGLDFSKLQSVSLFTSPMFSRTSANGMVLSLWDVTTNINDLLVPQTSRSDIFMDLQSGIQFSSSSVDLDGTVNYNLNFNSAGFNAVKTASGLFAVGASINMLTDDQESGMWPDGDNTSYLRLTFTTPVPEADTYGMLLAGLGMITIFSRRRK